MAITVNTNIHALAAQRNVARTQLDMQTSIQRLSSGLRINMAKDDAAGLAVAQRMEGQARGAAVAQRNIGDGLSALGVADSALRDIGDMLHRMRELAVQSETGTYSNNDRTLLDEEFSQLKSEIDATQVRATFNGQTAIGGTWNVIAGANGEGISITAGTAITAVTTIASNIQSSTAAATARGQVSSVLTSVAQSLAKIGSFQSRLEKAMSVAMAVEEQQWGARGRIMDADFARETSRMTSSQVIQQAGVSALAQANQIPQMALSLLR
jgi:flagellin